MDDEELDTSWFRKREEEIEFEQLLQPVIPTDINVHVITSSGDSIQRFDTHTVPVSNGVPQLNGLCRESDMVFHYDYDISEDDLISDEAADHGRLLPCKPTEIVLQPRLVGFLDVCCILILRRRTPQKTQKIYQQSDRHTRKMKQRF
tara:strand:- start:1413 stop:1853 length:441 start_codon:yes stop_codon:yes gene_type:complete